MGKLAIEIFTDLAADVVPFAFAWGICSIIVRTVFKAGFMGRFEL